MNLHESLKLFKTTAAMKFSNLKIGTRLGIAFGAMLLLLIAVSGIGTWRLTSVGVATERMVEVGLVNERRANEWATVIEVNAARTMAAVKTVDSRDEKMFLEAMAGSSKRADEIRKSMEGTITSPKARALFDDISEKRAAYTTTRAAALKEKTDNGAAAASRMIDSEMKPRLDAYLASAAALKAYFQADNDALAQTVTAQYESGRTLLLAITALAMICGIALAFLIARSITGPIMQAVSVARTVADSDLRSEIRQTSTDEAGQLLGALNDMNGSLTRIVTRVRQSTDSMATACNQIASGNLDLSQRTEEQASSLQQTAASMEEITSTVKQNYDNARKASELASTASKIAVRGGAKVAEVVGTMGSINGASKKIVDIIGVIDSIAFQTNILALNAAVEAARAGEQGRGFAVVASEVRTLAQRSATAAKEIKELINASVTQVEIGARQVDDAGKTMDEIVRSVQRVSDIMGEITIASSEQTTGIEQINQAISQMDQVTQQNAAMVEQAAAAAGSLQDQAAGLAEVVSVFKLNDGGHVSARLPSSWPAPSASASSSSDADKRKELMAA